MKTLTKLRLALLVGAVCAVMTLSVRAQDKITLLYSIHQQEPGSTINADLIQEYMAAHPDVEIDLDSTPYAQFEQKLLTGIAAGQGADVFWMGDWLVPQFMANNLLAPVDPTAYGVQTQDEFLSLFEPGALDPFTKDGVVYSGGISEYNTFSLIYNPDIFAEVGLPMPSATEPMTWEQLLEDSKQLTTMENAQITRTTIAWFWTANIWWNLILEPMVDQLGGSLVDTETGKPSFDSPEVLHVMQYLQSLRNENAIDPAFNQSFLDDFASGRTAMVIGGPWALAAIRSINPDAKIAVAPLPVFEAGTRTTTLYSWAWFVSANSSVEKQKAAWDFIAFLTSKGQTWWDRAAFIQPRLTQADDGQSISDYRLAQEPLLSVFLDDFMYGRVQARTTAYSEVSSILSRTATRIVEGEDPGSVLNEAQIAAGFLAN